MLDNGLLKYFKKYSTKNGRLQIDKVPHMVRGSEEALCV